MDSLIRLTSATTHEAWALAVLFEDEHLLALAKPDGLLVAPDRYDAQRPSLTGLLHDGIRNGARWAVEHRFTFLANAHRLDSEASGVQLYARTKEGLAALADQFSAAKPHLTYLVLVDGVTAADAFQVDAPLAPHPARPWLAHVDRRRGKKARTVFTVAERFERHTLLRAQPLTGRSHQLQAHLQSIRHPVTGDPAYSGRLLLLSSLKRNYRLKPGREELPLLARPAVHAEELVVRHPATGHELRINAPLPKDMQVALKYLRSCTPFVPLAPASQPPPAG